MSSIRLSGSTSGHYDLTVPATAGTNSIDLSNLPVKDSNGNLSVIGDIIRNDTTTGIMKFALQYNGADAAVFRRNNTTGVATISNGYAGAAVDSLNIDLAGRITTPNQPMFGMYTTANSGFAAANSDIILNAGYNGGNHVNTSTGVFTAPVSGRYEFSGYAIKDNSNGVVARLRIVYNGSTVAEARMDESGNYTQACAVVILNMSANDTVKFRNGDNTNFYMGGTYGRCNGRLIG